MCDAYGVGLITLGTTMPAGGDELIKFIILYILGELSIRLQFLCGSVFDTALLFILMRVYNTAQFNYGLSVGTIIGVVCTVSGELFCYFIIPFVSLFFDNNPCTIDYNEFIKTLPFVDFYDCLRLSKTLGETPLVLFLKAFGAFSYVRQPSGMELFV